jgi:hypothetical protein
VIRRETSGERAVSSRPLEPGLGLENIGHWSLDWDWRTQATGAWTGTGEHRPLEPGLGLENRGHWSLDWDWRTQATGAWTGTLVLFSEK